MDRKRGRRTRALPIQRVLYWQLRRIQSLKKGAWSNRAIALNAGHDQEADRQTRKWLLLSSIEVHLQEALSLLMRHGGATMT